MSILHKIMGEQVTFTGPGTILLDAAPVGGGGDYYTHGRNDIVQIELKSNESKDISGLQKATLIDGTLDYEAIDGESFHIPLKDSVTSWTVETREAFRKYANRYNASRTPSVSERSVERDRN